MYRNRTTLSARRVKSKPIVDIIPESTPCNHECCKRSIFVREIPRTATVPQLRIFFQKFGTVQNVRIIYHQKSKKHTGQAKIEFANIEDAQDVLTLPKSEFLFHEGILDPCVSRCQKPKAQKTLALPSSSDALATETEDVTQLMKNLTTENICFFDRLPDELINYIFSFLDFQDRIRFESVCKRWQYVNTKVAWVDMRVLRFTTLRRPLKKTSLAAILKRCGSTIREIDFSKCRHRLTHDFPLEIANYCPNLVSVNFTKTPINVKSMKCISESCKNLTTINLQTKRAVVEKSVCWVLKSGNIQHLDLTNNRKITGEFLRLVNDCMKTLILNGCSRLLPTGFGHLKNCHSISDLRLNNCRSLTTESLVTVIKSLQPSLTELHLGGTFANCDKSTFLQIFKHSKNLQRLNLEQNIQIDADVITLVSRKCLQLRYLNLNGNRVTDAGLISLAALPYLHDLHVSYVRHITDKGLRELSQAGLLEHLEVRGLSSIGDASCIALLIHCNNLKLLDVSSCVNITDAVVVEATHVRRSEDIKLKIIAGGTLIANFVDNSYLEVSDVNLCPSHWHPYFGELDPFEFASSDTDDDHDDFDDYEDYDDFFDPDYDDFYYELKHIDPLAF